MQEPFAAYWILLIGAFMPYALVFVAKSGKDYDNTEPRSPSALDTPFRRWAYGAHANSLEAFALFAAAVLLAAVRHAPAEAVNIGAYVWLASRLAFTVFYLRGQGTLRSLSWSVGFLSSVAILVIAILRGTGT